MSGIKYSQGDIQNKSKLIVGDGNMMGAIMDGTLEDWEKEGWEVDILKVTPPKTKRAGVSNYYFDGALPPKGKKYGELWLGFKPAHFGSEAEKLKKYVDEGSLAVSIMAGVTTKTISGGLGIDMVGRSMANTNSAYKNGQTALTTTGNIPEGALQRLIKDFESIGDVHLVSEDKMNNFTAAAASSPAAAHHLFNCLYRTLREYRGSSVEGARDVIFDAVIDNPREVSGYTDKVKDALLELELSTERGKESRGKGSLEGMIIKAVKSVEGCSEEELSCLVSGVVARFSKSLVGAAEFLGFSEDMSRTMVSGPKGVIRGSAITAQKSGRTFLDLKNAVTSVRGTTEELLQAVECGTGRGFDELVQDGMKACSSKGDEMGNPLKYYLDKSSQSLVGASDAVLKAAEPQIVAAHNETKQGLMRLQKLGTRQYSTSVARESTDDSSVDYASMKSLQSPTAKAVVPPKSRTIE